MIFHQQNMIWLTICHTEIFKFKSQSRNLGNQVNITFCNVMYFIKKNSLNQLMALLYAQGVFKPDLNPEAPGHQFHFILGLVLVIKEFDERESGWSSELHAGIPSKRSSFGSCQG